MFKKIRFAMYAPYTGLLTADPSDDEKNAIIPGSDTLNGCYASVVRRIKLVGLRTKEKGALTIFMAPEWTFRRRNGFYTYQDVTNVIEKLRQESLKPELQHMIIIPGSILWSVPVNRREVVTRLFLKNRNVMRSVQMVFNSVPIIHKGKFKIYHKLHNAGDVDREQGSEMPLAVSDNMSGDGFFVGLEPASGLFKLEGIQFGIEICRDYAEKTLLKEYLSKNLGGGGVDIHLIVASGIYSLSNHGLVARTGGYVALCEGGRSNAKSNFESNQVVMVTRQMRTVWASAHDAGRAIQKEKIEKEAIPETGEVGSRILMFNPVLLIK